MHGSLSFYLLSSTCLTNLTRMQSLVHLTNTSFFTFELDLGDMVTQNVAKYPPHHVTHGPGKFEVATSND